MFPSQAAEIFDAIAATDKQFETVAGDHYFLDPAGARDTVADLVADWVATRA